GNHHGPAFNASMPIDALLQGSQLHDGINVQPLRFLYQPFDRNCPRSRAEICRTAVGFVFICAEFVIVIVVSNVFERSGCFSHTKLTFYDPAEFGARCLRLMSARAAQINSRSNSGSRGRRSSDELASVQIRGLRGNLRGGYVAWLFEQHLLP